MGAALPIHTAHDAAELIAPRFERAELEKLVVVHLDRERRLLRLTELEGCTVEVALPIRVIIATALDCDAAGLVLAHNHPSGDPTPSAADRAATRRLADVASPLGIAIHDHLVFAGSECCSFRAMGLL